MSRKLSPKQLMILCSGTLFAMALGMLLVIAVFYGQTVNHSRKEPKVQTVTDLSFREIEVADAPMGVQEEFSWTIQDVPTGETCLAFYVIHEYTQVWIGEELIYTLYPKQLKSIEKKDGLTFEEKEARKEALLRKGKPMGAQWVFIPFSPEDSGKQVRILLTPVYQSSRFHEPEFLIGPKNTIYRTQLRQNLPIMLLSIILTVAGVLQLILYLVFRLRAKYQNDQLLWMGVAALVTGIWKLNDNAFAPLLLPLPVLQSGLALAAILVIPIPYIQLVQCGLGEKRSPFLDGMTVLNLFNIALVFFFHFTGYAPLHDTLVSSHAMVVIAVMSMGWEIISRCYHEKTDWCQKFVLVGLLACDIGGLLDVVLHYVLKSSYPFSFLPTFLLLYFIMTCGIELTRLVQVDQQVKGEQKDQNQTQARLLLSQIQPHFLYNCITVIQLLCIKEPMKAREALGDFANFLRGNMDAMTTSFIPFSQELKHVHYFLRLEKLRYGDALTIKEDIHYTSFFIPPLTVQPLIENAIRHGLKANGGGVVTLRTMYINRSVRITITDNGVGFDPTTLEERSNSGHRSHVGLLNVRQRIEMSTGGELQIHSVPGEGTTMTIILPEPDPGKNRSV